eukprot:128260_1
MGGHIKTFYHGVGEELRLPKYINDNSHNFTGVQIHCPLSTTSTKEVAIHFANYQGIIIQFGDNKSTKHSPKYFSVSWLSDYPNENEHLFINQTLNDEWKQELKISNIIDVKNAIEFQDILNALGMIEKTLNGKCIDTIADSDVEIIPLMIQILKHQLSSQLPEYEEFKSLHKYAKDICTTYFTEKKAIAIDYKNTTLLKEKKNQKQHDALLILKRYFKIFFHSNIEWINNEIIDVLFPKMTNVKINEINLCSLMLQQIVKDLKNKPMHSKLKKIEINASREDSDISVKQAIHEYAAKFRKIDVFVYKELAWNRLCIDLSTPEELALYLLENMEKKNIYIHDPNAEMTMIIEKALTVKDSKIYNYCSGKPKLEIDCKNMNENKGSDLFNEFYQPQNEWIKLKKLNSIFPGIGAICVKHTTLTATILEDILKHFRTNKKTILKEIKICNLHKSGLNISQAITQYKKQFDEINFDIKEDIDKNNANVENDVDEDDNYMNKTCLLIK